MKNFPNPTPTRFPVFRKITKVSTIASRPDPETSGFFRSLAKPFPQFALRLEGYSGPRLGEPLPRATSHTGHRQFQQQMLYCKLLLA
jgi:hypothetical protein